MRRLIAALTLGTLLAGGAAAGPAYDSWGAMADAMAAVCADAHRIYQGGDRGAAKARVDDAYFGFYEKLGFERTVMAYISGDRAAQVEYQFSLIKKAMTAGAPEKEVKAALDKLVTWLREDADRLDGKKESGVTVFIASLLIILREGFEAILIVGAIIAYLVKSGNRRKTGPVYIGTLAALGASVIMAFILNALSAASGANQEIVEGVTMLIAVAVLAWVGNWMISKAEAQAWSGYIKGSVQSSLERGSVFSLAFAAFLAVFREGAEVILFYQALIADTKTYGSMIGLGFGVGCVLLVAVYLAIRFLSLKLPLKPFFTGTSVLILVMAVSFMGSGIKELQEGNAVSVTPVPGIGSVDILGIYPTLETLIPQAAFLAVMIAVFVYQIRKWKRTRSENPAKEVSG